MHAAPAFAQTLNFGTGLVSATSKGKDGPLLTYGIGTDLPLSDRWSVRLEAGRRLPDTLIRSFTTERYLLGIRLDSRTTTEETSIADAAALLRFGSAPDKLVQVGVLAGVNFQAVDLVERTWIPQSLIDPSDAVETVRESFVIETLFDVGGDITVRVDERWALTAFGAAGLQPPGSEDERTQLRAGVFAQYRF